jgi:hypothetical protein
MVEADLSQCSKAYESQILESLRWIDRVFMVLKQM